MCQEGGGGLAVTFRAYASMTFTTTADWRRLSATGTLARQNALISHAKSTGCIQKLRCHIHVMNRVRALGETNVELPPSRHSSYFYISVPPPPPPNGGEHLRISG